MTSISELQEIFMADAGRCAKAANYLRERGIDVITQDRWGIGYCNGGYTGTPLDTLRGRLTFPIWDWEGRLVSFAGRTLNPRYKGAKYVNLPDNTCFKKHQSLYGLNRAIRHIAESGTAVVVEGYTDVIGCHAFAGMTNVVGSMGVAVTEAQLTLLSRWAKNVIIILDGDAAGLRAMSRIRARELDVNLAMGFVTLPRGRDPFDLALEKTVALAPYLHTRVSGLLVARIV